MQEGLHPPRKTLRPLKAMTALLLRTALWTSAILACGLYFTEEVLIPARLEKAAEAGLPAAEKLPAPGTALPRAVTAAGPAPAGTPAMVKKYDEPAARPSGRAEAPGTGEIPRLKSSGGWFASVEFRPGKEGKKTARAGRRRGASYGYEAENAVILPQAALLKKVELRGAGPVPASAEKKYTGADKEADRLREELLRRAEAERERARRLLYEKLVLGVIIVAVSALLTLLLSRAISAWRAIHRPEGPHWTLK